MSVVGGDITATGGGINAPGGQIIIGSVASAGEAILSGADEQPDLLVDSFESLGDISLANSALLDVSGIKGGATIVRGNRLLVDNSTIKANIENVTADTQNAINLYLKKDIVFTNGTVVSADVSGAGSAGDIKINTGQLGISNGSQVRSEAVSGTSGNTSTIDLSVSNLEISDNSRIETSLLTGSEGNSGGISIKASTVTATGNAHLSATTGGVGDPGTISLNTERLTLINGAQIGKNAIPSETDRGGPITVTATEDISIIGPNSGLFSNSSSGMATTPDASLSIMAPSLEIRNGGVLQATTNGPADAGSIGITVEQLKLSEGAQIDTGARSGSSGDAGSVTVKALNSVNIVDRNSGLFSNGSGSGKAGKISVSAPNLDLGAVSRIETQGIEGNITIQSDRLHIFDAAGISANILSGSGNAGDIVVTAENVLISGARIDEQDSTQLFSGIFSDVRGDSTTGKGGNISLSASVLRIEDRARISTFVNGLGNGGNINLAIGKLEISDGALLNSSTLGRGNGGTINVKAEEFTLSGPSPFNFVLVPLPTGQNLIINRTSTGIFALAGLVGGNAGNVNIDVEKLSLLQGAEINTQTFGPGAGGRIEILSKNIIIAGSDFENGINSSVSASTLLPSEVSPILAVLDGNATGKSGNIQITTENLELRNQGTISSLSSNAGDGGTISINASRQINMNNASIITASRQTKSGQISIVADELNIIDSEITAQAIVEDAEIITIDTNNYFKMVNSQITAEAGNDGGNITISSNATILENSLLKANATLGKGGNVFIDTNGLFANINGRIVSPIEVIDVSSEFGVSGTINIATPGIDLTAGLVPLPEEFLDVKELSFSKCSTRYERGEFSTFHLVEREGLSLMPDDLLPSFSPVKTQKTQKRR